MLVSSVNSLEIICKLLTDFDSAGSNPVNYISTSSNLAQEARGASRGSSRGGTATEETRGLRSIKVSYGPDI